SFRAQVFQQSEIAAGTHQDPNVCAGRNQLVSHVTADETGRAGNQRGHRTRIALFPGCGNFSPRLSREIPHSLRSCEFTSQIPWMSNTSRSRRNLPVVGVRSQFYFLGGNLDADKFSPAFTQIVVTS